MSSPFTVKANKSEGGGYEKAPPGNHLAVLVGVFDMGTQRHEFKGEESWRRDVFLVWELPNKKISGTTKNHVISAAVTLSLNQKATLRKWVEARTGKKIPDGAEFDITSELGKPCLLNVVANDAGYPRVEGVAAVPEGLPTPEPTYKPTAVSLDEFRSGASIPEWVPWHYGNALAHHIRASKEIGEAKPARKAAEPQPAGEAKPGDPIPF